MIRPESLHTAEIRVVSCDPGTRMLGITSFGMGQRLKLDTLYISEKYCSDVLNRIGSWVDDFMYMSSRNLLESKRLFCIENCFYNRLNPGTTMAQAEVIGTLIYVAMQFGFEIIRLDNSRIKRMFAGVGSATKEQMWEKAKPYHEQRECSINCAKMIKAERHAIADAIGIGVVGYSTWEAQQWNRDLFKKEEQNGNS